MFTISKAKRVNLFSSLKNFISIRDYLNEKWSSNPATDLRIFFLQHRHHSQLHFSEDRIHEAASYRKKIEILLNRIENIIIEDNNNDNRNNKPTLNSKELQNNLDECKISIRNALIDDFDTSTYLSSITKLVNHTNKYLIEVENSNIEPLEPLYSVNEYITNSLNILGIELNNSSSSGSSSNSSSNESYNIELINDFVEFRAQVRNIGLESMKLIKNNDNSDELKTQLSKLLKSCDFARDEIANKHLNIQISDDKGDKNKWYRK